MNASSPNPGGWLESLRRIGDSLLALLRGRFELFTVEWQEEKLRLLRLVIWLSVAVTFGVAGMLVIIITVAFWLWAVAGYIGLISVAVAALAVAGGILWNIFTKIETGPLPFAQTAAEFRKDGECLHGKNS